MNYLCYPFAGYWWYAEYITPHDNNNVTFVIADMSATVISLCTYIVVCHTAKRVFCNFARLPANIDFSEIAAMSNDAARTLTDTWLVNRLSYGRFLISVVAHENNKITKLVGAVSFQYRNQI